MSDTKKIEKVWLNYIKELKAFRCLIIFCLFDFLPYFFNRAIAIPSRKQSGANLNSISVKEYHRALYND